MVPFPARLGDQDATSTAALPHRRGTLLFAAEKAAATIKVIQDGRNTLLGGMPKEAAKQALQSGM